MQKPSRKDGRREGLGPNIPKLYMPRTKIPYQVHDNGELLLSFAINNTIPLVEVCFSITKGDELHTFNERDNKRVEYF